MSTLRVYFQAANPGMLFSQIDFLDMDVVASNGNPPVQQLGLFSNRGYTFGVNVGF
jgi:hypothetical protein